MTPLLKSDRPAAGRPLLLLIILAYLLLGVVYVLVTPPLEASDEYKHYPVVQFIQTTGRLVVLDPADPGKWLQEGAQPPLYYLLMAGLTAWIDTGDLDEIHDVNPHAYVGNPNQLHNKNLILHQPAREAWPWRGTILAVYLIRLASLALGAGTLWFIERLGRILFGPPVGLLAAGLTAVNPMFLFVSAAVNNDSLSILLGTAGLTLLVRLWQELDGDRPLDWRRLLLHHALPLGLVCGLGLLTKLSLAALLALAGLVTALQAWRRREPAVLLGGGMAILLTALLLSGWWLWRSWELYGDPTGLNVFVAVQGTRDNPTLFGVDWPAEFGTFFRSYWGLFGGVNVAAPQGFYWLCNFLLAAGLAGLALRPKGERPAGPLWLPAVWIAVLLLLLIRWNIISPAFQGRLIFPALGSINALWAAGLWRWFARLPRLDPGRLAAALVLGLALLAALIAGGIDRAYAFPEPVEVPAAHRFGPYRFVDGAGNELWLVGVDAPAQTAEAGNDHRPVRLSLYWQLPRATTARLLTAVDLLGAGLESIGRVNRYPGRGMWPTDRWQPGEIYRDDYQVVPSARALTPIRAQIRVGAANLALPEAEMAVWGPDGRPLSLVIAGSARVEGGETLPFTPATALDIAFAEGIRLAGATVAGSLERPEVTLYWAAGAAPAADYTVFVQLLDPAGRLVGSGDAPPLAGDLPTSWWRPGDQIVDPHVVIPSEPLRPGVYRLAVGLYDPQSGIRLPRLDGGDAAIWEQPLP